MDDLYNENNLDENNKSSINADQDNKSNANVNFDDQDDKNNTDEDDKGNLCGNNKSDIENDKNSTGEDSKSNAGEYNKNSAEEDKNIGCEDNNVNTDEDNKNNTCEGNKSLCLKSSTQINALDNCNGRSGEDNKSSSDGDKRKKKKRGKGKIIASYIAVGVICCILGGTGASAFTLYYLPKMSYFKQTPLYKTLNQAQGSDINIGTDTKNTNGTSTNDTQSTVKSSQIVSKTEGLTVTEIAKKVGPAVVGVSIKTASQTNEFGFSTGEQEGMGSGIIFSADGYILTNYHVISSAKQITVILYDGKEVPAKVVNYDSSLDLAVIKVTQSVKMPAVAEFGNSKDLQVGDSVVAIGNPLGKNFLGTVTSGIVSAVNREIQTEDNKTQKFIQTDAAINAGNSGGPLINSKGQVIGINSAKISESGVEGLGFSIPIDTVKPQITSLLKPALTIGIGCRDITADISKAYNIPEGVYVAQVNEYSSAEKAGIEVGDVIVKFDGQKVTSTEQTNSIKNQHNNGDIVKLDIVRNGKSKSINLKLSE